MKYIPLYLFLTGLISCESHSFDADRRQILAKDEIRQKFNRNRSVSILSFSQDTVANWADSALVRHPIRYTLNFTYNDSTGTPRKKQAVVLFAPDAPAVLSSQITDLP